MICQRCGCCCVTMDVIIRVGDNAVLKPHGIACPHLQIDGSTCTCKVHEEPWFIDTPCHVYGNPDIDPDFEIKRGKPCRVGQMIVKKGLRNVYHTADFNPDVSKLKVLGPWQ